MQPDPVPSHGPTDLTRLAERFEHFARAECGDEPVYAAICHVAARMPDVLELLQVAHPTQRRPNLLLAALHDAALRGTAHAMGAYFESPSSLGKRLEPARLEPILRDFCTQKRHELLERIHTRVTQTNEIGRCAVLWPMLRQLVATTGRSRIALLDFGCSAGLNLGVDRYRYSYQDGAEAFALGAPAAAGVPVIECRLVGSRRPDIGPSPLVIATRQGIDPTPLRVDDPDDVRWLRACIWPSDAIRRKRLDEAINAAVQAKWPVYRFEDCSRMAALWAGSLPRDVMPVIFNSWVLTYFDKPALAAHIARMRDVVQGEGAAWISAEEPRVQIGDETVPEQPAFSTDPAQPAVSTLWKMVVQGDAAPRCTVVARSHAHGKWLEWFGSDLLKDFRSAAGAS